MTSLEKDLFLTRNSIKCCQIVCDTFNAAPELESPRYCHYCGTREDALVRLNTHQKRQHELRLEFYNLDRCNDGLRCNGGESLTLGEWEEVQSYQIDVDTIYNLSIDQIIILGIFYPEEIKDTIYDNCLTASNNIIDKFEGVRND